MRRGADRDFGVGWEGSIPNTQRLPLVEVPFLLITENTHRGVFPRRAVSL